jgi:hypothetical protein
MGVSLGGVTVLLQQFPKTAHFENFTAAPIMLQLHPNLYYGRCDILVHVKLYFKKIDVVLSEILADQKCIK